MADEEATDQAETPTEETEKKPDDAENEEPAVPPPPLVKQKLYMLEFIVDDISLDFCNAKQLICFGVGKTVVEFKFLDIGPLRITEDDFVPIKKRYLEGCTGTGSIKNGKSIIFGLTPDQAKEVAQKTILYCDCIKKTDKKEHKIGSCIIRLINLFKELLEIVDEGGQTNYYKNIKDFYKIKDTDGMVIGHLYAYIRMSCFNEIIVNKFKKDPNAEIDYKPEKGVYNYKYNRSKVKLDDAKQICECKTNKSTTQVCECPAECPQKTCPQVYIDNKCIFDCPQTLRPCEDCPPTCAANKAAGLFRTNKESFLADSKSKASKKSGKSAKSNKKGNKNKKKK